MTYRLVLLLIGIFLINIAVADETEIPDIAYSDLAPELHHRKVSREVTKLLTRAHYKKRRLDDKISSETFDRFLEKLDYYRLYFHESDVAAFEEQRYSFDNYLGSGQVERAYEIFNLYQKRYAERLDYVFRRLEVEFDYNIDESLEVDRSDAPWAKNSVELDDVWRKRLKHAALNLKLAGKEWPDIQKTLRTRYIRATKNLQQYQSEDVFQTLMNAFSESFDPHTNYFSPKNFDDFKIRMSQSLEGIGARLLSENEYTKVVEIVAGGPADKSEDLHPNDRIMAVGQNVDGELVDIVGWRIDDVVQLIRGKKTTIVRLVVLRADDPDGSAPDTVSLVRDRVKLEDQSVTSKVIELEHLGKVLKIGVVEVPTFYSDFDAIRRREPDYKSTTRDTKRAIEAFKKENIDGVVIDLRRNGGGFLNEAVDLTGLFIDRGPVVQVKSTQGTVDVESDRDPSVTWDGPLAVMIDRLSASASEIFAAAIQDYNRGLIVGSQSFGKGTVQRPVDLNRLMPDSGNKLGQVKMTIAKFYRVNGNSTQHIGVMPDISLPTNLDPQEFGESTRENALLYDKIDALQYAKNGSMGALINRLDEQHNQRIANDQEFNEMIADLQEFRDSRSRKLLSLQESVRKAERQKEKEEAEAEKSEEDDDKDLLLTETAHIIGDFILLEKEGLQSQK
ncbi:MAG: carboxy terminal-processing peptidase [Calditrichia bacterium]